MTEFSYPFDGGSGAILTEDDWSDMAKNWQDDGVIAPLTSSTNLRVTTLSQPNTIILPAGSALVQGFMYRNTADLPLTFSTNSSADPRKDRVVLRLDRNTNTIQALVKEGVAAVSPVAPTLNTTYPIYEITLANFQIAAGASTVGSPAITIDRPYTSRYIRFADSTSGHPLGSIVYNTTNDTFYTIGSGGIATAIGASGGFSVATSTTKPSFPATGTTVLESDTKRLVTHVGSNRYFPPVGMGFFATKAADGASLTGATTVVDPELFVTIPQAGLYRASGTVYYSSTLAAATAVFSLTGPASPTWVKGVFHHINTTTNIVHTTTTSYNGGCSIGTVAATTIYAVTFDYLILSTVSVQDVAVRTSTISGGTWQLRQGSYIRVERIS